jgi:hypothetical protein
VELVTRVDPGHIAALGRQAAKTLRKSIVVVPGKKARVACAAAVRHARLRALEMQSAGIEGIPLLNLDVNPVGPDVSPEFALTETLRGLSVLPEAGRRRFFAEAVKQYLVAIGDAESTEDDDESEPEADAAEDGRETHIHKPHVVAEDGGFAVVDDDGKVYGKHKTKAEADAQVRALYAAKGKE